VTGLFANTRLGGYIEGRWAMEREAGALTESGFELTRMALVLATNLHQRVQVTTEVEIEDGGEEIELELAQADFAFRRGLGFRAGVLLVPLGKFNLAHDGPRTELPQRPVVATDLLGSALSQPGLGVTGEFLVGAAGRLGYQGYSVTGYGSGILSSDGTRLPAGQKNFEDENNSPAWVGLIECSPGPGHSVALSGYTGAYNVHRVEGLDVDERRDVRVVVGDLDTHVRPLALHRGGRARGRGHPREPQRDLRQPAERRLHGAEPALPGWLAREGFAVDRRHPVRRRRLRPRSPR
jgi:hypothetical protein